MNRWRKHVICLLLVTFPVSLWAAVAAPEVCDSMQAQEQAQTTSVDHAHHGSHGTDPAPAPEPHQPGDSSPCCDTCLSACLASSLTVLELRLAVPEPVIPTVHYKLDRATQFLAGPSYPSLYRPPIASG